MAAVGLALLLIGTVLAVLGFLAKQKAAELVAAPPGPVSAAAGQATAAIEGHVEGALPVTGTLTGRPCAYVYQSEEIWVPYRRKSFSEDKWVTDHRCESKVLRASGAFFVKDASGKALVIPTAETTTISRPPATRNENVELRDVGLMQQDWVQRRLFELSLGVGDRVYVSGTPRTVQDLVEAAKLNAELYPAAVKAQEAGPGTVCFFVPPGAAEGVTVNDRDYATQLSEAQGSQWMLAAGGACAAVGAILTLVGLMLGRAPSEG